MVIYAVCGFADELEQYYCTSSYPFGILFPKCDYHFQFMACYLKSFLPSEYKFDQFQKGTNLYIIDP
jgi:hypothetical protein